MEFSPSSSLIHPNTCGLKPIRLCPNKSYCGIFSCIYKINVLINIVQLHTGREVMCVLRGPKPDDGDPPDGACGVPAAGAGDGVRAVKAPQLQHARLRPPLQPRRTRRGHVLQLPAPERLRRTEVHWALHRRPTCWCLISLITMIAGRDTEYN